MTPTNRIALRLLKGVGILGMGGSALAFGFATFAHPGMFAQAVRAGRLGDGVGIVFDAVASPLQSFFLAGLLFVAADIALRMPTQRPSRHDDPG